MPGIRSSILALESGRCSSAFQIGSEPTAFLQVAFTFRSSRTWRNLQLSTRLMFCIATLCLAGNSNTPMAIPPLISRLMPTHRYPAGRCSLCGVLAIKNASLVDGRPAYRVGTDTCNQSRTDFNPCREGRPMRIQDKVVVRRRTGLCIQFGNQWYLHRAKRFASAFVIFFAVLLSSCASPPAVTDLEYQVSKPIDQTSGRSKLFSAEPALCEQTSTRLNEVRDYLISLDACGEYQPQLLLPESSGCGASIVQPGYERFVRREGLGELWSCRDTYQALDGEALRERTAAFQEHTNSILDRFFDQEKKHLLLYIHGGLNGPEESRIRAIRESYIIKLRPTTI